MSKPKHHFAGTSAAERGLNAFHGGRFDEAIALWEPLANTDPRVAAALAEVYFRRALSRRAVPEQQMRDFQRATDLVPNDTTYQYHLGLAYHRRGELATALLAYEMAMQGSPRPPGLIFTDALATIESNPSADLSARSGLSEHERSLTTALAAFMRGAALPSAAPSSREPWWRGLRTMLGGPDPVDALWRGLLALHAGEDKLAGESLSALTANLPPKAGALRRYYLGISAARQGDLLAAQAEWEQARTRGLDTPWLLENLSAIHEQQAVASAQAERWAAAAQSARGALLADPRNVRVLEIALVALDRLAHEAVARNDWPAAGKYWAEAKDSQAQSGADPSRSIWQNLAIAYEAQEQWEQAGEAWRGLLRTKPRGKKAKSEYSDAQWEWIRKRAAEVFQQAERPEAAVEFLKKAVKSDPKNIARRLELASALLANDQEIAARNQLQSAQQLDPNHVPTLLKLAELHVKRGEWFAAEQLMHAALKQSPHDEQLRQHMAQLLTQSGSQFHASRQHTDARKVYEQALTYTPNNPDLYIALARVELDSRQIKAAREHLQKAVALDPRRNESYVQVMGCWTVENNLKEVRAVLAQAEADAQPDARFYLKAGLDCLGAIPSADHGALGLFGSRRAPAKTAESGEWEVLAQELLDRALALRPDDPDALRGIVRAAIAASLPRLGLRYVEHLRRMTPDDPLAWVSLGLLQGLNEQVNEAKKTLHEAARLARRQGNHEAEQTANEMRRQVGNPMFAALLNMAALVGPPGDRLGDEEEDEILDEFFWLPPGRRKGWR